MMANEKTFDGEPVDYDNDDYNDFIEATIVENKKELFQELDLLEATPRELLLYFANRYKEVHGFEYVIEWVKEIAIFKSFKERYQKDSGPMIELLFEKHGGKINDMVMTATAFSKGSKWIQDTLYIELQQQRQKEENKTSTEGLMDTSEFLKRFAL
jgi:hypothetical protein